MQGLAQDTLKYKTEILPERTIRISDSVRAISSFFNLYTPHISTQDSVKQDSITPKPEVLTDVVEYKSKDYASFNRKEQKLYLYNQAEVYYEDMELKAGIIIIDYNTNIVYAKGIVDSLGNYTQTPSFKQAENLVEPDSIKFNYKNEKALIYNSRTKQSEFHITAPIVKKENDSVVYMYKPRFTTSETPEDPEYYFQTNKIKFVPNKKIVVGVTNMVIEDVPTPLGVPFGYFPLTDKQTSGVLIPTFGEESNRGFFLQNGGYYFAVSDFFDLAVLGDYYTNGSYGFRTESNYAVRYKFNGQAGFRFENLVSGERGFPGYSKSTIYNIRWTHNQDQKANPNSRFSASVNLGSQQYYQESINQINTPNFLNNTLASSISYSKTFLGEPQVNLSLTATHSQNTSTGIINMTLPTFQANVGRIFPFAPKAGIKKGILQNINFQYSTRAENRFQIADSLFFKEAMFDAAQTGVQHSIPISTNFKLFKFFSFSTGTNYTETWAFKTTNKYYDAVSEDVLETTKNGFASYRTYNFSASLGTTIYGMFNFEKKGQDKKIKAIRHVMRPSIGYSINPSFDQYYDQIIDADGNTIEEYTRFENTLFGVPNKTKSSAISLSLSNNLEAKVRDKDTTATEPKKIVIFNNLNLSTAYNLTADSLRWAPLRVTGGTQILNGKMSINFSATMDPYALDSNNRRIDIFNIENGGSLFRLTNANITSSYTLSNDLFSGNKKDEKAAIENNVRSGGRADDLFGITEDYTQQLNNDDKNTQQTPSELYNQKIPWNLRLAYAVNYSNNTRQNEISSHSLMFSGDIEIAPRWSIGGSSGYDFKNHGFTYTQLRFERDLLSWRMNFSWVPFSARSSWYFFIGIKSSLLKDIKYDKRKQPDEQL